jgi:hypothetical protein
MESRETTTLFARCLFVFSLILKFGDWRFQGQGELAGTLVLTIKMQLLEMIYFCKFDTKIGFKSMKLVLRHSTFNQQGQK